MILEPKKIKPVSVPVVCPSVCHEGFPGGASGKESTCPNRRHGFDPWVGKIPWRRKRQPTQFSCLENLMDRGAWWATVHGVTKSQTQLKRLSTHICHEVMGADAMILALWMLSLKPAFSLSSFTFIKRLYSSSSLSAITVCHLHIWGYRYFSQQSWYQLGLHPARHFAWCTLHISWISRVTVHSLGVLLSQFGTSVVFCVQFWLLLLDLHTDLSRGRSGDLVFPSLKEFSTVCCDLHSQIINEAEVDGFLEFPCFFCDPTDVSNLISGPSAFSKSSLFIWKFLSRILLKPSSWQYLQIPECWARKEPWRSTSHRTESPKTNEMICIMFISLFFWIKL